MSTFHLCPSVGKEGLSCISPVCVREREDAQVVYSGKRSVASAQPGCGLLEHPANAIGQNVFLYSSGMLPFRGLGKKPVEAEQRSAHKEESQQ